MKAPIILKKGNILVNEEEKRNRKLEKCEKTWITIRRKRRHRCTATNNLNKLWKKKKHTTLEKRLKIYNTLVTSILLYNSSYITLLSQASYYTIQVI